MTSPRSIAVRFALSIACLAAFLPSAFAVGVAVGNLPTELKVVYADIIVTGKIVSIEKDTVEAAPFVNAPNKEAYQIGLVRIEDSIHGAKGLTQIRIGWQVGFKLTAVLEEGQEGCFFLQEHPSADFYDVRFNARPLLKKADNYDQELTKIKSVRKIIDQPLEALKSDKADERKLAASVLVLSHGRSPAPYDPKVRLKQEPIDEEQSRLILKAVGEMNWDNPADQTVSLSSVLGYLKLTPDDGWKQPAFNGKGDYGKVMKETFDAWLKQNGEKFRIKRLVAEK